MKIIFIAVVLLSVAATLSLASSSSDAQKIKVMQEFQDAHQSLSIERLDPLLSKDIITRIPFGTAEVRGKQNVLQDWRIFMSGIQEMRQRRTGPFEINENVAGYTKENTQRTKKGCNVKYTVFNWFIFDEKNLIKEYNVLFNLTSVIEQNKC